MSRILIDDKIKELASAYVTKLPLVVGDVEAALRRLANELQQPSTDILICKPFLGKKAKTNKDARRLNLPDAVEAANAGQPLKEEHKNYKVVYHRGSEYHRVSAYVEGIANQYSTVNNLLPSHYDDLLDPIVSQLGEVQVENVWIKLAGKDKHPLYELIVDVMGYQKVRTELMPYYISKLEIRSCVYCNAQYAMTTLIENVHDKIKTGKRGRPKEARVIPLMGGYYELDHNKPKSKYPYLCTNFYNLQPCCSACNKRKSVDEIDYSMYYEEGEESSPLRYAISPQDVIDFHTKGKCKNIEPYLCNADNPTQKVEARKDGTLAEQFNYYFDIDRIYAEHKDEVEELLWRNRIYTRGIVDATSKQFQKLGIDGFDFKRYILGTYPDKKDALKRPLTMMKQDIWEQVTEVESD